MITEENIKWYFQWMKSKSLDSHWEYHSYREEENNIVIIFIHNKSDKMSSYYVPKDSIIEKVREIKLKSLFD